MSLPVECPRSFLAQLLGWLPTAGLVLAVSGCSSLADAPPFSLLMQEPPKPVVFERIDPAIYQRAGSDRAERLEKEVERLRGDLRQAEEALVSAESGLVGNHSRADAVSSLAEARIGLARAARRAPWRAERLEEAQRKLDDADAQIEQGNFGAAVFFVYRARRIAKSLEREADQFESERQTRFVRANRANLRSGPSTDTKVLSVLVNGTPVFTERVGEAWALVRTTNGNVGWVHKRLLGSR